MKDILYYIADNSLYIPIRTFASKVYFDGLENFPSGKPVFLACNHPNSFLDGVLFEDLFRRRIYTLVRGDVFMKPVANYILRGLRLLPIFRSTDAAAKVARKGNDQTLEDCYRILKKRRCILIFSEGIAYPEKAVRRVKNGTAHMAIQLASRNDFELDLHVVPVGMNYEEFGQSNNRIQISFGEAIPLKEYKQRILEDEKVLAREITKRIQETFDEKVLSNKDRDEVIDFAQTIALNHKTKPYRFRVRNNKVHISVPQINKMTEEMKNEVKEYKELLKKHKVRDENLQSNFFDFPSIFFALFTAGVSFPAFLISAGLSRFSRWLIRKVVKSVVFQDSIYVGANMVLHWFWYVSVVVIGLVYLPSFWPLVFYAAVLYGTYFWHATVRQIPSMLTELNYIALKDNVREDLKARRKKILDYLFNQ